MRSARTWELGGILYQRPFPNEPPPSWFGYPLDNQHPSSYGGVNYTEYYKGVSGYGLSGFPGPVPLSSRYRGGPPNFPTRPSMVPPGYVPTSELFKPEPVALLDVEVPADAEIWLEGTKTKQIGPARKFVSPALTPGKDYEYEIHARWQENGRERAETQKVIIRAGARVRVQFPKASPAPEPEGPDL